MTAEAKGSAKYAAAARTKSMDDLESLPPFCRKTSLLHGSNNYYVSSKVLRATCQLADPRTSRNTRTMSSWLRRARACLRAIALLKTAPTSAEVLVSEH